MKDNITISHLCADEDFSKQGYVICGKIDGFPDDIKLYILKKQL